MHLISAHFKKARITTKSIPFGKKKTNSLQTRHPFNVALGLLNHSVLQGDENRKEKKNRGNEKKKTMNFLCVEMLPIK